jgi:magnesium-transporting ATPase (P-type)
VQSSIGLEKEHWNNETGVHLSIFFDTFVFLQVFNFFNARKLGKDEVNVFSHISNNYLFIIIIIGIFLCQLFIIQFGGKALMLVPLTASQHLACICIGALSLVNGFVFKKFIPDGCFSCIPILN